jgi:hypothetical protein
MLLSYGKKFTDQWGATNSDELIAFWADGLAGFSHAELKRGKEALDGREWPPTLPEFKKLCRPPVNELTAYYEAIAGLEARGKGEEGSWSHPALYWAASSMRKDLESSTYSQVKDRWGAVLRAQLDAGAWADIPPPRVMLPPPEVSKNAKKHAENMLHQLGAAGIFNDNRDHRAWAKKILEREKRGDKSLSSLQIRFAREAMGLEVTAA